MFLVGKGVQMLAWRSVIAIAWETAMSVDADRVFAPFIVNTIIDLIGDLIVEAAVRTTRLIGEV